MMLSAQHVISGLNTNTNFASKLERERYSLGVVDKIKIAKKTEKERDKKKE